MIINRGLKTDNMAEIDPKYIYTGSRVKSMNNEYPWNGTIINSEELDDRLKYVLEFTGYGGMSGSLTRAVLYRDPCCKCHCCACKK